MKHDIRLAAPDDLVAVEATVQNAYSHYVERIGRKLLAFAEQQAADAGFHNIRLYTNEAMTENINLYQRIGYVETHRGRGTRPAPGLYDETAGS